MQSPVRVFLIHRYRLLIDSLRLALASDASIDLVGQVCYFNEGLRRLAATSVDVVVLEADLDEAPARPMIRELRSSLPEVKILPIGLESTAEVLQCIEAGASGYLELEASLEELVMTLRLMGQGKARCSPEIAVSIFERIAELARHDEERSRRYPQNVYLTKREKEILDLLGRGLRNKEIARELEIAVPTVKNHVHKVLDKLGAKRRRDAVRIACDMGLLEDPLHPRETKN